MEEDAIQIGSRITIWWNVDGGVTNIIYVKKNYISNPDTYSCENGKYLVSIIDHWGITSDEIINPDAEAKAYDKESKTFNLWNKMFLYFTFLSVNCNCIIERKIIWKYFNLWHFIQKFYGCKTFACLVKKMYGRIEYLILFAPERYNANNGRFNYYSWKSGITCSIIHNFARIRIDSCNSLPIGKILTFHNDIIFIKSVFNNNENNCYYNIFTGKGLYEDKSNTSNFGTL